MNKTTLHTPSPWIVQIDEDNNDSSFTTIKIVDGSSESLSHPQGALTLANVQTFAPHIKEGIANAYLIAAAPELLDALKALMQRAVRDAEQYAPDGNEPIWAFISDASDAILKAERGAI